MGKILEEFGFVDKKKYRFAIGTLIATSLSGFLFGLAFASIVWMTVFKYIMDLQ